MRIAIFAALLSLSSTVTAAEPWADPKLPVTSGLELWLDAARATGDQPVPADKSRLEAWQDASGHGRHVRQTNANAQPLFARVGPDAVLRFNGDTHHLRFAGPPAETSAFTVFIVVAPRASLGGHRGIIAFNSPNQRDYQSGLNIDIGPDGSAVFDQLNVEGAGFGGARNLVSGARPYGPLHTLEVSSTDNAVRVNLDGKPAGERPRTLAPISLAELTIGARYFTNGPGAQQPRGFYIGDLAEVLVFSRELKADEFASVRKYLDTKHARLKSALVPLTRGGALERVANPPAVQMLVPGFTVQQIPLDLPNVNNVRYRPDGALLALCYNGDIYRLRDTDGDGMPDKADLFWDNKGSLIQPIGMALTPPGYKHGDGCFVAAKGKCSLIVDTDGDGKADKEIVIAEGWPASFVNVDATGVAFDNRDGSVYFGLGCANFVDAYQRDKEGKGHYSLKSDRGTIQRIKPDLKSRETVCTGIRFPIGLAFNRQGDLFSTDQEGATWLPNGNPFDEFLHIQTGRHYGFPPRHPKHLPNVIDEPSVYDYGPQHQCTCGFFFNEPVNGGPGFGPAAWAGDAIVTGESRGKLYRTQLVKTPNGYIARNQIIACINMLTIDGCGTPDGGAIFACHSGKPDWGTGPSGKGKLFKISYSDRDQPQPTAIWPAGSREVHVAFDRPIDPEQWRNLAARTKLTAGRYVRAGDRFESFWPGYQVVQMQLASPRYDVPVRSVQISADRRTLILATDPHAESLHYALTLPKPEPKAESSIGQAPEIDLDYDLSGVEARWQSANGEGWTGWLPHVDLDVARALTAGSANHDRLWTSMATGGELTLRAQINLADMLRPAVQPGARIDYEWPAEDVTLTVSGNGSLMMTSPGSQVTNANDEARLMLQSRLNRQSITGRTVPVEIRMTTTGASPSLRINYYTHEDARPRALPLSRIFVPWAPAKTDAYESATPLPPPPELEGGSWARGRKIFFDDAIGCAKCHAISGRGDAMGPDLSNLVHRDYGSVLRDITEPNAAINPDYVSYAVHLHDGRVMNGAVRTEGSRLLIGDGQGRIVSLNKSDVELLKPLATSIMPEGQAKTLGPERLRDLMTFLLTAPRMPVYEKAGPPPARPRAEVQAVLAGAPPATAPLRPLRLVLVAGAKDHGVGEHDYPAWQKVWAELLAAADQVTIEKANDWPNSEQFRTADTIVFYQRGDWTPQRARDIDMFLERGGGLVYIHWAVAGGKDAPGFARRIGLASNQSVAFRHGPLELDFKPANGHAITRNLSKLKLVDESYWNMIGDVNGATLLATAMEQGQSRPLVWTREPGKGRIFVSIPGHYSWTFDDPLFRALLLRGIAWSAREPVDRFNELVWPGARVAD